MAFNVISCNNNTLHLKRVGRQRSEYKGKEIYYMIFKSTHRINKRFYHTPNFSTWSSSVSAALLQRDTIPCAPLLYHFEFFTRSHFFTFFTRSHFFTSSIISSFLQSISPHLEFLKTRKRWKSEGTEYGLHGGWGRRTHLRFYNCYLCFQTYL